MWGGESSLVKGVQMVRPPIPYFPFYCWVIISGGYDLFIKYEEEGSGGYQFDYYLDYLEL